MGPDFLLGERLARGEAFLRSLGIPWILSGLSPDVLVHKVGNLHLAPVGLDHSDRTIAVAQEPGDLLCLFQLTHLVQQGSPPGSEGKVDEQVRHVLACAIFDSIDHLLEA